MVDNKLRIRIQIKQTPSSSPDEFNQENDVLTSSETDSEQYSLDWKKISIALLLLFSVLGFITYALLARDTVEQETEKITEPSTAASTESTENQSETSETKTELSNVSSAVSIDTPKNIIDDTSKTSSKTDATQIPIRNKPVSSATLNKPVIIPARKPQQQHQTLSTTTEQVNQTYVARALLTLTIKGREPKDSIDSVTLNNKEVETIYFYLHLINLQGKAITIIWYHNDKQDSKLTMQVHSKNWRTYASKLLNKERLGSWRVELQDESGNILAVKKFTVVQS
ncbi:MAG: DUF2914 domain-containing protein [Nitrosomonas sp.]|nr:DUF2914 domain-containing protein [Nitrosomonas sp.]